MKTISKVKTKLDFQDGKGGTLVRDPHHQTLAGRHSQQVSDEDEYKPDPRDLAYQAARELRAALEVKLKNPEPDPTWVSYSAPSRGVGCAR
ncbi:MAG: hypothetical protein ACP5D7_08115 [Limnospira sp.]